VTIWYITLVIPVDAVSIARECRYLQDEEKKRIIIIIQHDLLQIQLLGFFIQWFLV